MFIVSVLSFIAGIYFETLCDISIKYTFLLLITLLIIIPFLIEKYRRICVIILFLSFFLAGMLRIGLVINAEVKKETDDEFYLFETVVSESNKTIKVLKVLKPDIHRSSNAILRTEKNLEIGDSVNIYGQLKEISITYKNPHIISWKWLKRLEGINFEIKGNILSVKKGERAIHKVRRAIKEKIELSGAKHSGIIKALVLGDRTAVDEEIRDIFQKTGTSHILAISGLHVGIITGFFFFITRWVLSKKRSLALSGKDKRYAAIITIIFPVLFMILSGSSVSTIRATFMVSIFLMAIFFEKQRDIFNTVFLSALFILLIYPHSLFTPSFQLSFLSVIFIVLFLHQFYHLLTKTNSKIVNGLLLTVITTFSATVGTLPAVLYHFYGINLLSILHNLISIPLICLVSLPMALIGVTLPLGGFLINISGELLNLTIQLLKALNFGYLFPLIRPSLFETILFYTTVISIIFIKRKIVLITLFFIVLPVISVHSIIEIKKRFFNELCINFIDVGMGDSILIEAPKGKRILIDGGQRFKEDSGTGRNVITPILLSKKILTLDYVINTHPHGDHMGGLFFILEHFKVKKFISSGFFIKEPLFLEAMIICKKKNIDVDFWFTGDGLLIGDDFKMTVLNPDRDYHAHSLNNASLVFMIRYREKSMLLTGDIEREIEERLIMKNIPLKAHVLKVPHHGSNNASTVAFLTAVRPDLAVLTAGKGVKGLPGKEALQRYLNLSIRVLSTLDNGFIKICTDGKGLYVEEKQHLYSK